MTNPAINDIIRIGEFFKGGDGLKKYKYSTKNIIIASVILVVGIGGLALKFGPANDPIIEITKIAVAMFLGIILNLILRDKKKEETTENK